MNTAGQKWKKRKTKVKDDYTFFTYWLKSSTFTFSFCKLVNMYETEGDKSFGRIKPAWFTNLPIYFWTREYPKQTARVYPVIQLISLSLFLCGRVCLYHRWYSKCAWSLLHQVVCYFRSCYKISIYGNWNHILVPFCKILEMYYRLSFWSIFEFLNSNFSEFK